MGEDIMITLDGEERKGMSALSIQINKFVKQENKE
jgi:hypothetical protein